MYEETPVPMLAAVDVVDVVFPAVTGDTSLLPVEEGIPVLRIIEYDGGKGAVPYKVLATVPVG